MSDDEYPTAEEQARYHKKLFGDEYPTLEEARATNKKLFGEPLSNATDEFDDHPTDEAIARNKEKLGLSNVVPIKTAPTVIDTRDGIVAELNARGYGTVFKDDKFKVVYIDRYGVIHFYTKKDFVDSMAKEKMLVTETSPGGVTTGKFKPVSLHWLEHNQHKEYEKVIFDPSREHTLNDRDLNLFPGFAFKPKKGQCYKTLMYIRDVICNGDKDVYRWLMAWSAHIFQNPREKPETAVAIQGEEEGTGKSFFPHIISRLLDKQNMGITQRLYFKASNAKMITGDFSGHLEHCLVLHAEEAFSAESNKEDSIIKDLISGDEIGINAKNIEAKLSRNYIRLILTGNPPHIVKVSRFARRFLVLKISAKHALDTDYFRELSDELVLGGYEALMYYFMHYPIYKYNLRIVKKTKALFGADNTEHGHTRSAFGITFFAWVNCPLMILMSNMIPVNLTRSVNHAKSST